MAPTRSTQGARLNSSHHTRTASAHTSAPITAPIRASGATIGKPNQSSHSRATATTPGHSRSGFLGAGSSVLLMGIAELCCGSSMLLVVISFTPNDVPRVLLLFLEHVLLPDTG